MKLKLLTTVWKGLTHNTDGTFSSTKFWQAVGYIVSSYIMLWLTWNGKMSSEYLLIYLGAITTARGFQNYLAAKGQQQSYGSTYSRYPTRSYGDEPVRPPREL